MLINPTVNELLAQIVFGTKIKIAPINSKTPMPIRPKGSNTTFEKI